jgi:SAM-dependent methyltransferase
VQLEPTGERMMVDDYQATAEDRLIYHLHVETYRFAEAYTRGRRVLDFGCGSGYGSAMIARSALHVTGVDVAADAVAYAAERHGSDNLDFQHVTADGGLPFADASFDTVLSFQVFEHVEHEQRYLQEIARVLVPGGTLLLVTPDRSTRLLPLQQPWNRWHLREYSERSLRQQLVQQFDDVRILGMGGDAATIGIELRRCRRMMWLSLPFTLPFYPRALRVGLLNLVHRFKARPAAGTPTDPAVFAPGPVRIAAGLSPSLNLVAVVRKRQA